MSTLFRLPVFLFLLFERKVMVEAMDPVLRNQNGIDAGTERAESDKSF